MIKFQRGLIKFLTDELKDRRKTTTTTHGGKSPRYLHAGTTLPPSRKHLPEELLGNDEDTGNDSSSDLESFSKTSSTTTSSSDTPPSQ